MNSEIKKVLKKIEQNGYEAYIVGGFVRDHLLKIPSNDVDISTNALPKEIQNIFGNAKKRGTYGTYNVKTKRFNYDITTYRKEENYTNRHPNKIKYTTNLIEDITRRDFTINAICMNAKGNIIDLVGGVPDINSKILRMIGNPKVRLKEDPLRILRAIRFASTRNFQIEESLWKEIKNQKKEILTLSKERIKKELDSLLISPNFQKGLDLLETSGILQELEIIKTPITYVTDVNGMWAQMQTTQDFKFSNNEKKIINNIRNILKEKEMTPKLIFDYGLYPVSIAAKIKGIPETHITKMYKKMPIHEYQEIKITFHQIQEITKKSPKETKQIQTKIIQKILDGTLKNKKEEIVKYMKQGDTL